MVKVIFQAIGDNEIRLAIGRNGEANKKIDLQELPTQVTEDVEGSGIFVTAVDIRFEGGKPLNTIHAWTNTSKELKIGYTTVNDISITEGNIRITKEG